MTNIASSTEIIQACWEYLILGMIQGLTEFIPISSTAHLTVIPTALGWGDPGVSTIATMQLGSILAVIIYFKKDLRNILKGIHYALRYNAWKEENARLGIAISLGTIPILLAGILIKLGLSDFDNSSLRSVSSIALTSIFMSILLAYAEKKATQTKAIANIQGKEGIIIGIGQMLAIIPGVSRSGITLTTSLFCGLKRQDAARFSFLLGIPSITFAGLAEFQASFNNQLAINNGILPLLIGITSAALFSWISIDWLLKYLGNHSTWIFISYRMLFGIVLICSIWF